MTQLIDQSSPEYFQQTSDGLYDRHDYKLLYTTGKSVVFEDYQDVQVAWFQTPNLLLSHIEVLNKKNVKGFK